VYKDRTADATRDGQGMVAAGRSGGRVPQCVRISGREKHLAAAIKTWDFIDAFVIDHRDGEWYARVSREAFPPGLTKVDFWNALPRRSGDARDHGPDTTAGVAGLP